MAINVFTGLVPEVRPTWRDDQITLPPMAGEVAEKLWDDPPPFIHSENQQQTNSCSGHGGSTGCEGVQFGKSGENIQLSRWGAYILAQKRCGLLGRDVGATLGGLHDSLKLDGIAEESIWKFTGQYDTRIPPGALENAAKRRITHSIDVETGGYDSCRLVIGQNIGSVVFACYWPLQINNGIDVFGYNPLGNGGHCMVWVALSSRKDARGRPCMWGSNSHLNQPWLRWWPDAIDAVCRRREWGCFGITDMTTPKPRKVEWSGRDNPFAK